MEFEGIDDVCVLGCKHCYHTDCIAQWLKHSKVRQQCDTTINLLYVPCNADMFGTCLCLWVCLVPASGMVAQACISFVCRQLDSCEKTVTSSM